MAEPAVDLVVQYQETAAPLPAPSAGSGWPESLQSYVLVQYQEIAAPLPAPSVGAGWPESLRDYVVVQYQEIAAPVLAPAASVVPPLAWQPFYADFALGREVFVAPTRALFFCPLPSASVSVSAAAPSPSLSSSRALGGGGAPMSWLADEDERRAARRALGQTLREFQRHAEQQEEATRFEALRRLQAEREQERLAREREEQLRREREEQLWREREIAKKAPEPRPERRRKTRRLAASPPPPPQPQPQPPQPQPRRTCVACGLKSERLPRLAGVCICVKCAKRFGGFQTLAKLVGVGAEGGLGGLLARLGAAAAATKVAGAVWPDHRTCRNCQAQWNAERGDVTCPICGVVSEK